MKTLVCVVALALFGSPRDGTFRQGQHDFDFDFGTWKTHSSRLLHPLTGSTDWIDMDGATEVRNIWEGRANLAEFKADGPSGHLELLSLRTYNPTSHQWSLAFAMPLPLPSTMNSISERWTQPIPE
jgi:hypothetical protein